MMSLLSEPAELELLSQMLSHYSEPDQKDDNRFNCVLSLGQLYPRLKSICQKSLSLYLDLSFTLVKLLVDELAEVDKTDPDQEAGLLNHL